MMGVGTCGSQRDPAALTLLLLWLFLAPSVGVGPDVHAGSSGRDGLSPVFAAGGVLPAAEAKRARDQPHARLRQHGLAADAAPPALAPVRCLVAGQIQGGRGQGAGSGESAAHRPASARGSSLEEEVRRSGSCILGFGANDAGQLVLGHARSTRVPQLAEGVPSYKVPCEEGRRATEGTGAHAAGAGRGANETVRVGPPVAAISAGGYHTVLLDLDGSVFAVGENFRGQLGNGFRRLASLQPELITHDAQGRRLPPVRGVAAGSAHSLFVTTDGFVYACGEGSDGRLGLAEVDSQKCKGRPQQIRAFRHATWRRRRPLGLTRHGVPANSGVCQEDAADVAMTQVWEEGSAGRVRVRRWREERDRWLPETAEHWHHLRRFKQLESRTSGSDCASKLLSASRVGSDTPKNDTPWGNYDEWGDVAEEAERRGRILEHLRRPDEPWNATILDLMDMLLMYKENEATRANEDAARAQDRRLRRIIADHVGNESEAAGSLRKALGTAVRQVEQLAQGSGEAKAKANVSVGQAQRGSRLVDEESAVGGGGGGGAEGRAAFNGGGRGVKVEGHGRKADGAEAGGNKLPIGGQLRKKRSREKVELSNGQPGEGQEGRGGAGSELGGGGQEVLAEEDPKEGTKTQTDNARMLRHTIPEPPLKTDTSTYMHTCNMHTHTYRATCGRRGARRWCQHGFGRGRGLAEGPRWSTLGEGVAQLY